MNNYYLNNEDIRRIKTTAASLVKVKVIELMPTNGQKSFNHRAHIIQDEKGILQLMSYETIVASFDPATKQFKKNWSGYSPTTMKHINAFCDYCKIDGFNKKQWEALK